MEGECLGEQDLVKDGGGHVGASILMPPRCDALTEWIGGGPSTLQLTLSGTVFSFLTLSGAGFRALNTPETIKN